MLAVNEIADLIEKEDFKKAEQLLLEQRRSDRENPTLNYLLGVIYDDPRSGLGTKSQARDCFRVATQGEHPVEDVFVMLARLESNRRHRGRILRKGLVAFPQSSAIYESLLWSCDTGEKEAVFLEARSKGFITNEMLRHMIGDRFSQGKFSGVLQLAKQYTATDKLESRLLQLVRGFCHMEMGKLPTAKKIFNSLIVDDISYSLGYVQYFGLILCLIAEKQVKQAHEVFSEIPVGAEIDAGIWEQPEFPSFDLLEYVLAALDELEATFKKQADKAKARAIRGLCLYDNQFSFAPCLSQNKGTAEQMRRDLSYAAKHLPLNARICEAQMQNAAMQEDFLQHFELSIKYLQASAYSDRLASATHLDYSSLAHCDKKVFDQIVESFERKIRDGDSSIRDVLPSDLFSILVERLYDLGDFDKVVTLADLVGEKSLKDSEVTFQIAYSYYEKSRIEQARRFYEHDLRRRGPSHSTVNNLALIVEKDGILERAEELYKQAYELEQTEVSKLNLDRVRELRKAAVSFGDEIPEVQRAIVALSKQEDTKGILSHAAADLERDLALSGQSASALVQRLVDCKYLRREPPETGSKVMKHRINPEIRQSMAEYDAKVSREIEMSTLASDLSVQGLHKIGYDDELVMALKRASSQDIEVMLQRDLKEAAVALLSKSFKSSMIMCGSIVEAFLLDKIAAKSIKKYTLENGRAKSVSRMDLNELLYIAHKEKMVGEMFYHLAHAVRGFRNLIHPGLEQRRSAPGVSERNALMAWEVTKRLIMGE
jgi:tetratricopeptide (TPR) repeat protein